MFSLKYLGKLNYILAVEVCKTQDGLHLSQANYVHDLLDEIQITYTKPVPTPMIIVKQPSKFDGDALEDATLYYIIIGTLQYCILIRLDIRFLVNKLFQYLHFPTTTHWLDDKRLLRCLK